MFSHSQMQVLRVAVDLVEPRPSLSLNLLKNIISGAVDEQKHMPNKSNKRTSNICCRHAIHGKFRPTAFSSRVTSCAGLPGTVPEWNKIPASRPGPFRDNDLVFD